MKILEKFYAFLWTDPASNNCNTYFIDGAKKILVDPGHYHLFGHVRDHLSNHTLSTEDIDVVITTHGHPDHLEGNRIFESTSALIAMGEAEWPFVRDMSPLYGDSQGFSGLEPDILLKEGTLKIGDLTFEVIQTPGHSPGSICLYWPDEKVLFTGDVIFNQGVGRTDLPGGNGDQLKESIIRLSDLDVEILLPGHGDILTGSEKIKANFSNIENVWFGYL